MSKPITNNIPVARAGQCFTMAANEKNKHLDVYLYGVIGSYWDSNTIEDLQYSLRRAGNVDTINVYINTIGGTFYDGLPIYNTLKNHPAQVTTIVMGYALSMGSVIMLSGDEIQCPENAIIMMHGAQGSAYGDARRMRKIADQLDVHENAIIPTFARRMSKTNEEVQAMLEAETWLNADTAKALGLIDTILEEIDMDQAEQDLDENAWEFAANHFDNPPDNFAIRFENKLEQARAKNQPWFKKILNTMVGKPPAPIVANTTEDDEIEMDKEELKALLVENNATLKAELKEDFRKEFAPKQPEEPGNKETSPELAAMTAERDQLKTKLDTLEAENKQLKDDIEDLSKPDPNKNTQNLGENNGPDDKEEFLG